jgi:phosphoglycolate phosphatase
MRPKAILFDLDGTLADTAPDLGRALNLQRERHGLLPLPDEVIRPYASHGSGGLLGIGFSLKPEDAAFAAMRDEYLTLYDAVFCEHPELFDGMAEVLSAIERMDIPWGVVTNKPRRFTVPLMQALGLAERAASIVSGDDCEQPKPHPDPLLLASRQAGVEPSTCWYVGDAERDIIAGRAAGMRTLVATYGYLGEDDRPESWNAQGMIATPKELLELLDIYLLQFVPQRSFADVQKTCGLAFVVGSFLEGGGDHAGFQCIHSGPQFQRLVSGDGLRLARGRRLVHFLRQMPGIDVFAVT